MLHRSLGRGSSLVLALVLLVCAVPAHAQKTGGISGTIRNGETGELLDYANVVVTRDSDKSQWGTMSLGGGRFFLRDLPAGNYTISILYLGYKKVTQPVTVVAGKSTNLDFNLEVTVVKTFDEFVVEGQAVMVEVKETEFTQTVHSEDLTDYAVDSVEEAVAQQAGIVARGGELYVRGGRSGELSFRIDGVAVDDPLGGGSMGVGSLGVANVETVTGGQDPEYGNALSGVVNVTTREGGDKFEARFRYLTDDFGRQDRTYTNFDRFEFAFGGPTGIPRLTYFVNGDLSFSDNENYNRAYRPESEVKLLGVTLWKWRRRQTNQGRGSLKLAYKFDDAGARKITAEITTNFTRSDPYLPNWDVQGYAQKVLTMPEIESVSGSYRFTGRTRRVYYGPWVQNMQRLAHTVRVAVDRGEGTFYEPMPVLQLRDTRGSTFLAAAQPQFEGFQYPVSRFSTVQEDSSYVDFNSANRGPESKRWSTQAKIVWRHALNDTDFYTLRLARLEFNRFNSVSGDLLPYEFNHGGIDGAGTFFDTQPSYQISTDFATDQDNPFLVTSGDYYVFRDQKTVQYTSKFDITSTRYKGHKIKSGFKVLYNDLRDKSLTSPAVERLDRLTGEYSQGSNRNVFHSFNPEASYYLQDRWEHEGMVVNGGFRWDMFSPGSAANILLSNEGVDRNVLKYKTAFSPRIGFAFPITDRDAFHFHYGRFIQFPERDVLFASQDPIGNQGSLGNPNLQSMLTIAYQAGIRRQFNDYLAGQMVVYWKDIYGLVATTTVTDETTGNTLRRFVNKAFANARGVEFTLDKRYSNRWSMKLAYTFAFADGVASDQNFGSNPEGLQFIPNQELPLNWDRRHSLHLGLRVQEPDVWAASMTFDYGTGFPWTPVFRFEKKVDPLLENSRRHPDEYDLSLQAERHVNMYGQKVTLFLQGLNLINQDVVTTEAPFVAPVAPNAQVAYTPYLTDTGKYGGALLYDVDGSGRNDYVPVNDPRVFQQHRIFRVGIGWQF